MSDSDISRLIDPQPDHYTPQVWAAVAYAREWALTQGNIKKPDIIADFEKHYAPDDYEHKRITIVIRTMNFANKSMNTWTRIRSQG